MDLAADARGTNEVNDVTVKILAVLENLQDRLGRMEVSLVKRDEEDCV